MLKNIPNINPIVFGIIIFAPIVLLYALKLMTTELFTLSEKVIIFPTLPLIFSAYIVLIIFVCNIVENNITSLVKVYIPIFIIGILMSIILTIWSQAYLTSTGYTKKSDKSTIDTLIAIVYSK